MYKLILVIQFVTQFLLRVSTY